ncbi:unnamed protein product [Bursaphelenchus okinawaensis]|uniref:PHD-type domain-containing protein n=1 Tax=Bursaphelenchus okinawaensis TaxID=465554 RepID=A0A811KRW2_9BILA|nr:unnamed protein product [Bursaphelenchus okinawaensis]CAG9108458.1 unnamed protein product [Bursaphelenchus okinawaensis]
MNPTKSAARNVTRTPLRAVPNQKRVRRNITEEFGGKDPELSVNTNLHSHGYKRQKVVSSPSLVSAYSNESTDVEDERDCDAEQPSTSKGVKEEVADKNVGIWDWRATQIGSFMKKRRYLALKKRLDVEGTGSKEIFSNDSEIFLRHPAVAIKTKRSKYDPHEECFVTDISHRTKRVVLFRKRRHAQISGQVTDEMVRKVQVPVDIVPEERIWFSHDLTDYINEEIKRNVDIPMIMEMSPADAPDVVHVRRLTDDVAQYFMDDKDKRFWLQLNKNLEEKSVGNKRDENNKKVIEPLLIRLRNIDFSYIMGVLETVCFKEIHGILLNVLNVPNQAEGESAFCEICHSETSDSTDPIVFCEGCNLSVHQKCFGITELPKDEWYCDVCKEYNKKVEVRCKFCPLTNGTMKHTIDGGWAHFSCSIWQVDLRFDDLTTYSLVSHEWNLKPESFLKICCVCDLRYGSCIKCTAPGCKMAFHPTCGVRGGLLMFIEDNESSKMGVKMLSFCYYHSEEALKAQKDNYKREAEEIVQCDEDDNVYEKSYKMSQEVRRVAEEGYKRSKLRKVEDNFDSLVNWRKMADDLGISRDIMKEIFYYWTEKRRENNNRIMVNQMELNEIYIKKALTFDYVVNKEQPSVPEETSEQNAGLVKEFSDAHWKLDRCRNLCTLTLRREKLKLMKVVALKEAVDWVMGESPENMSHFSSRTMEKLLGFWTEFSGKASKPSKSVLKKTKSEKVSDLKTLFSDLLDQFVDLDPSIIDDIDELE